MSVFNKIPCPDGACPSCDVLQRGNESTEAWYARLRARIAAAPRTCEGVLAHPWTPENIKTTPGGQQRCRPCEAETTARRDRSGDRGRSRSGRRKVVTP